MKDSGCGALHMIIHKDAYCTLCGEKLVVTEESIPQKDWKCSKWGSLDEIIRSNKTFCESCGKERKRLVYKFHECEGV